MLKAIIFDLDGVIVDSQKAHKNAWRCLLESLGREVSDADLDFVMEGRKRHEILHYFFGELSPEQVQEYGSAKQELFRRFAAQLRPIAGVLEFVTEAKQRGLPMGVATCAGRRRAHEMLERFGLTSSFAAVVTGDDVAAGKPDPAVFQMTARQLAISPENILVCEDAVAGVEAAKRAAMKCLAICANRKANQLRQAGADLVAEDFRRLRVEHVQALLSTVQAESTSGVNPRS